MSTEHNGARVGVAFGPSRYPDPPFDPPARFAEFEGTDVATVRTDPSNSVYAMVREALFRALGGYSSGSGCIDLKVLRRMGPVRKVLVKPNWVRHDEAPRNATTTHASVIRPVVDYAIAAFGGQVEVIVADVPIQSADLDRIWQDNGTAALVEHYRREHPGVRFLDLRRERAIVDPSGFKLSRVPLAGDPIGYREVHLGVDSNLEEISGPGVEFSVADYEPGLASCQHRRGDHRYLIAGTVLASQLVFNVAKLKTHSKAGMTGCMKNLIGINGEKGWIPHYRKGAPAVGGDEYPDAVRRVMRTKEIVRQLVEGRHRRAYKFLRSGWRKYRALREMPSGTRLSGGGAWPGNDTIWRPVLDLVRVLRYADTDGIMRTSPSRGHICIMDGIVAGEGEGPLDATPRDAGTILCSLDPLATDIVASTYLGFDWSQIPQLRHGLAQRGWLDPTEWVVLDGEALRTGKAAWADFPRIDARPPSGWERLTGGTEPVRTERRGSAVRDRSGRPRPQEDR